MTRIKLAFVTQFPVKTNQPLGGVEAVSINLIRSLSTYPDLDIQVITLCASTTGLTIEKWSDVTVHRLPKPGGSELINAISKSKTLIANYVSELKPDLIHAHDTYGIMVQDLAIPKVFTVHGFIHGDTLFSSGRFKWLRSKLWEYVEKSSWANQPNIISISPYVRERVSAVSDSYIYDIDNPISDVFFKSERNEKAGTVFTSAIICRRKNPLVLVKAVGLLVAAGYEVQLRIAGSVSDEAYSREMIEWITENNLGEYVHLLGRISTQEVLKELSHASIYALASLEENSPMGIEEAMAIGVAVVASNRCGMPYMVKNGETGYLIDPFDEKQLANRIKTILDNGDLKSKMEQKAKALALDLYHSRNVARRTHAVYQEIVESKSAGPLDIP